MTQARKTLRRLMPYGVTAVIFLIILRRIPLQRLVEALQEAELAPFLGLMVANAIVYFCWDTLVLTYVIRWFHGPIRYRDMLPARAGSYAVAMFNTNLARGALAAYLARRVRAPFLQLGSTVIFLLLTEYTHLIGWATLGMTLGYTKIPQRLFWVPPTAAVFWLFFLLYARAGLSPWKIVELVVGSGGGSAQRGLRHWSIFRTFKIAPVRRYVQVVLMRAPMFFVSLCFHYFAASAFGIHIPFAALLTFLPIIFMLAALPITVAHLGTTQVAWIFFFGAYAPEASLLAFSLAAHATFMACRALLGVAFVSRAYRDLTEVAGALPDGAAS